MKHHKTIIIGCGASGAFCGMTTKGDDVAIIDAEFTPAKKLLVTGNGRCNLTNLNINSNFYNVNIDKFLNKFNLNDTLNYFKNIGLITYADEEGRMYPISNSAKSVQDCIINKLQEKNIPLYLAEKVIDVNYQSNLFEINTDNQQFSCNNLVISIGSKNAENILNSLNVKYTPFVPSLVSLKSKDIKNLNGIRLSNVKVTATCNSQTKTEFGEVLFKENGISGICVFNLSTLFSRQNNFNGAISIDVLPNYSKEELIKLLNDRKSLNIKLNKYFVGMFQNAIADELFKQAKINTNKTSLNLNTQEIEVLASTIKNLTFNINGVFENNQVFCGGVNLEDLTENLESKSIPHLYFTGEVCNVDGVCGGYNLQWAFTSGFIVGENLWLN